MTERAAKRKSAEEVARKWRDHAENREYRFSGVNWDEEQAEIAAALRAHAAERVAEELEAARMSGPGAKALKPNDHDRGYDLACEHWREHINALARRAREGVSE